MADVPPFYFTKFLTSEHYSCYIISYTNDHRHFSNDYLQHTGDGH